MNKTSAKGHLSMTGANIMWGLMAPISKIVLSGAVITPLLLTNFRIIGAAAAFWVASFFTKKEQVSPSDLLHLFFASLLGIVFNQGSFLFGVSLTSPIDASIITTSTPILTMILSALYLHEPITGKKISGVFLGASGALLLIVSGTQNSGHTQSNIWGNLLCLTAQLSYSLYFVFYKGLIMRYSPFTLMKWMFTYATLCAIPFSYPHFRDLNYSGLDIETIGGILFVVFGGTFISYILVPIGQRILRPTVATMYNYVQPIVAGGVAIYWGLDHFNLLKLFAIVLIFSGVFLVTQSKSRAQMEAETNA